MKNNLQGINSRVNEAQNQINDFKIRKKKQLIRTARKKKKNPKK